MRQITEQFAVMNIRGGGGDRMDVVERVAQQELNLLRFTQVSNPVRPTEVPLGYQKKIHSTPTTS